MRQSALGEHAERFGVWAEPCRGSPHFHRSHRDAVTVVVAEVRGVHHHAVGAQFEVVGRAIATIGADVSARRIRGHGYALMAMVCTGAGARLAARSGGWWGHATLPPIRFHDLRHGAASVLSCIRPRPRLPPWCGAGRERSGRL